MSAASRWRNQQIEHDDNFHQWCDETDRDPDEDGTLDDFTAWCEDQYAEAADAAREPWWVAS